MAEIGYAALGIIPSFDGLQGKLEGGTSKAMAAAGIKGGDAFGDSAGKSAGSRFNARLKTIAKVGAATLAGAAAVGFKFAGDALEEARESQKVGALTESTIKATGKAAKVTAQQVGDLAGAISEKSGVDDEAIQRGANLILTFKGIRNEAGKGNKIFDRATRSVTDMAAAMAGGSGGDLDLKSASIQIGKALNDPIKGMTALTRVGVTFTDQQKAMVTALQQGGVTEALNAMGFSVKADEFTKKMDEMGWGVMRAVDFFTGGLDKVQRKQFDFLSEGGHMVDAQKLILDELNSEFGGAAAAQATEADKLKVAWGNFKEEIGTELIPVMDDLAVFLRKKGIPAAQDFIGWIRDDGVPAIKDFAREMEPVVEGAKDLAGYLNDLPKSIKIGGLAGLTALIGFSKLRGGNLGGGGGVLGSAGKALGLAKPVPVFVTNKGGIGGAPIPGGGSGGGGFWKGLGAFIKGGATPAAAAVVTDWMEKWFESGFKPGKGKNGVGDKAGQIVSNIKLGQVAGWSDKLGSAVPFLDTAGEAARKGVEEADKALAALVNSGSADSAREQFKALRVEAEKQGVSIDELKDKFPKYAAALGAVPKTHVTEFLLPNFFEQYGRILKYGRYLQDLDGKTVTTFLKSVRTNNDIGEKGDPRFGGFRANGGSAERGKAYIVGERRPELFVPNTPGRIVPEVASGAGVQVFILGDVRPNDYGDFMGQMQQRATRALLDGRRP